MQRFPPWHTINNNKQRLITTPLLQLSQFKASPRRAKHTHHTKQRLQSSNVQRKSELAEFKTCMITKRPKQTHYTKYILYHLRHQKVSKQVNNREQVHKIKITI